MSATSSGRASTAEGSVNLAEAYSRAISASSAEISLSIKVTTPQRSTTLTGSGAFDWAQRLGSLNISGTIAGQNLSLSEVLDGDDVYVKLPAAAAGAFGGKPWIKIDVSQLTSGSTGANPAQILSILTADSSSVTRVGSQTIGGVATTEYRATVDPTKAAKDASPTVQKILASLPSLTGSATFPVDVWIDAKGLPRRITYAATLKTPPAGASSASAAFPETTTLTMDLGGYGVPVSVSPPPSSEVTTESLPGLLGGSTSS
jgi:hypothetical protein